MPSKLEPHSAAHLLMTPYTSGVTRQKPAASMTPSLAGTTTTAWMTDVAGRVPIQKTPPSSSQTSIPG
jgi:hypothetical protein